MLRAAVLGDGSAGWINAFALNRFSFPEAILGPSGQIAVAHPNHPARVRPLGRHVWRCSTYAAFEARHARVGARSGLAHGLYLLVLVSPVRPGAAPEIREQGPPKRGRSVDHRESSLDDAGTLAAGGCLLLPRRAPGFLLTQLD